jgi:hypothetical protein
MISVANMVLETERAFSHTNVRTRAGSSYKRTSRWACGPSRMALLIHSAGGRPALRIQGMAGGAAPPAPEGLPLQARALVPWLLRGACSPCSPCARSMVPERACPCWDRWSSPTGRVGTLLEEIQLPNCSFDSDLEVDTPRPPPRRRRCLATGAGRAGAHCEPRHHPWPHG